MTPPKKKCMPKTIGSSDFIVSDIYFYPVLSKVYFLIITLFLSGCKQLYIVRDYCLKPLKICSSLNF